jgi:acyl-CoA synthetase (AMP-forming)/AMP-acid ligase II
MMISPSLAAWPDRSTTHALTASPHDVSGTAITATSATSYKKPRSVDFLDALPRVFNGKVDKKALRAKYWQSQDRQVS